MQKKDYKYVGQIMQDKPVTQDAITEALSVHHWDVLYYATEKQICSLIDQGKIEEDFSSRWEDYQEELRCMRHEIY